MGPVEWGAACTEEHLLSLVNGSAARAYHWLCSLEEGSDFATRMLAEQFQVSTERARQWLQQLIKVGLVVRPNPRQRTLFFPHKLMKGRMFYLGRVGCSEPTPVEPEQARMVFDLLEITGRGDWCGSARNSNPERHIVEGDLLVFAGKAHDSKQDRLVAVVRVIDPQSWCGRWDDEDRCVIPSWKPRVKVRLVSGVTVS